MSSISTDIDFNVTSTVPSALQLLISVVKSAAGIRSSALNVSSFVSEHPLLKPTLCLITITSPALIVMLTGEPDKFCNSSLIVISQLTISVLPDRSVITNSYDPSSLHPPIATEKSDIGSISSILIF